MQIRFAFRLVALAACCSAPLVAGERIFRVTGTVRDIPGRNRIIVAHEDIPGFMPAMTMSFTVADPAEAAPLKAGDRVRFQLHVGDTSSQATDILLIGHEDAPSGSAAGSAETTTATPSRRRLREGDRVPAFALTTENNRPFTQADLRGHATLVTFIFTRCALPEYCPAMAARFGQLQKAIGGQPDLAGRVRLLSITLDPEFDRPAVLKSYARAVGANPALWQFATGGNDDVAVLAKVFAVHTERNGVTLDHTLCTALIDGEGRVVEFWRGNGWRVDDVLAALSRPGDGTVPRAPR